ncbi:hypothetical protein [Vacuolonema iberomarrocanum]|uniref:hypothetical protein n=1 Tax=Vacuolonema iberomarrocanum TaxID=3454632 RepID=UPI001A0A8530|nr:hypothetical protein [filamentous cyanobacterium LEGE 07170]
MKAYARIVGVVLGTAVLLGGGLSQVANAETLLSTEGILEEGDQVLPSDSSLYDEYTIEGASGQTIVITMSSEEFVPYLAVLDPENPNAFVLGEGGDASMQTYELTVTLPRDGSYLVIANGFDSSQTGNYTLEVVSEEDE